METGPHGRPLLHTEVKPGVEEPALPEGLAGGSGPAMGCGPHGDTRPGSESLPTEATDAEDHTEEFAVGPRGGEVPKPRNRGTLAVVAGDGNACRQSSQLLSRLVPLEADCSAVSILYILTPTGWRRGFERHTRGSGQGVARCAYAWDSDFNSWN